MPDVNGHHAEPGCYVDGHWGQYGPDHLAEQAETFGWTPDQPTDDPRVIRRFADALGEAGYGDAAATLWQFHSEAADDIENWLNEHTSPGFGGMVLAEPGPGLVEAPAKDYVWYWHDGEFFLAPICDPDDREECDDPFCAHWD